MARAARKRLKLDYDLKVDEIQQAFQSIGEEAKDFLEYVIVYDEDPGKRELARQILGYSRDVPKEAKIIKNVDD
jgi:hypothetical protein